MTKTYYYLTEWSEDIMPCGPTLDEWAEWLSKPDADWNRPEAAKDGDTFSCATLIVLGETSATFVNGAWTANTPVIDGTTWLYKKHDQHGSGWDVEFAGDTIEAALHDYEADQGETVWLVCTKDGPHALATFHAKGPFLTIEAAQ